MHKHMFLFVQLFIVSEAIDQAADRQQILRLLMQCLLYPRIIDILTLQMKSLVL